MKSCFKVLWKKVLRPALSRAKYLASCLASKVQRVFRRPAAWFFGGPSSTICRMHELCQLTPERVLSGYAQGIFPTGERNNSIVWHCPVVRAVIPADQVHVSKRLKGYLRKERFEIRFDHDFARVMESCADRQKTWITREIIDVYRRLHTMKYAHSVEAYLDDELVGGGYGVALGRVFFLESMFCREDHASKIAFVALAEKLRSDGFEAIDCQFLTEHWRRFGAKGVPHEQFQQLVARHLNRPAAFSNTDVGSKGPAAAVIASNFPSTSITPVST